MSSHESDTKFTDLPDHLQNDILHRHVRDCGKINLRPTIIKFSKTSVSLHYPTYPIDAKYGFAIPTLEAEPPIRYPPLADWNHRNIANQYVTLWARFMEEGAEPRTCQSFPAVEWFECLEHEGLADLHKIKRLAIEVDCRESLLGYLNDTDKRRRTYNHSQDNIEIGFDHDRLDLYKSGMRALFGQLKSLEDLEFILCKQVNKYSGRQLEPFKIPSPLTLKHGEFD
jgi:hypothetical protein